MRARGDGNFWRENNNLTTKGTEEHREEPIVVAEVFSAPSVTPW